MKEPKRPVSDTEAEPISRRVLLQKASAAAVVGIVAGRSIARAEAAEMVKRPSRVVTAASGAEKGKAFPDKFLWGCATAGHQVEGNNINSDLWAMEHMP